MKNLFAVLTVLLATAYAYSGTSGYTESIDYDGTLELPHNPYKGEIKQYKFSVEKPTIEQSPNHQYGFDRPLEECFNKESYPPQKCFFEPDADECKCFSQPSAAECLDKKKYPPRNCFIQPQSKEYYSKHPRIKLHHEKELNLPVTYISTKKGTNISFIPHFSKAAYDKYCIVGYQYETNGKDVGDVIYANEVNMNGAPHPLSYNLFEREGIVTFRIFPIKTREKNNKSCSPTKNTEFISAIKVLPYEEDEKKYVYIQMDGGVKNIDKDSDYPNAFTKGTFDKAVDDVFKQAVIKATGTDGNEKLIKGNKHFQDELIEVELTNPKTTEEEFNKKLNEIYNFFNISSDLDIKSEAWHIVIAINRIRKKWHLGKCISDGEKDIKLSACYNSFHFEPELESPRTKYFLKSAKGCRKGIEPDEERPVTIRATPIMLGETPQYVSRGTINKEYHVYDENNTKLKLKECDTLFTDNGYPVIPLAGEVGSDGVSLPFRKETKFGKASKTYHHEIFDDYLPYGAIVITRRNVGDEAYATAVHELAHSYGLTDVSTTFDSPIPIQNNTAQKKTEYANIFYKTNWGRYINSYGTQETNLMGFVAPGGFRIRHRESTITCTSGQDYYTSFEGEKTSWKKHYIANGPVIIEGTGENQWDCLRDCLTKHDYSTPSRKNFWKNSGICSEYDEEKILPLELYKDNFSLDFLLPLIPIKMAIESGITRDEETGKTDLGKLKHYSLEEVYSLKKFPLQELSRYYPLEDFINCYDYNLSKKCYTLDALKLCKDEEIDGTNCFTAEEFRSNGSTLEEIESLYSNEELMSCKFTNVNQQKEKCFTADEFKKRGISLAELKKYYTINDLKDYFSLDELAKYYSNEEIMKCKDTKKDVPCFTAGDLKLGGINLNEIKNFYKINELKDYFSLDELFNCRDAKSKECFSPEDFYECTYYDGLKNKSCFETSDLDKYFKG